MSKLTLDSVEWGEFKLVDIFDIKDGYYNKKPPIDINGDIPFLGATKYDNGITGYYKLETIKKWDKVGNSNSDSFENRVFDGNCLAITNNGSVGNIYYQEYQFTCSHDVTPVYLKNKKLNKFLAQFLAGMLKKTGESFEYAKKWRPERMRKSRLLLPITSDGFPNWQFMEDYIKQEMKEQSLKVVNYYEEKLLKLGFELLDFDVEWKEFWMEEILNINSGVRLTKADQVSGDIPFIGASDSNNGVTEFIGNVNNSFDSNVLGVNYNGSVVENFYHPYECIFSDDVKRIKYKNEEFGDEFTYLFLKQMILSQKDKYKYGYKFNAKRMNRQKIMLPVDNNGELHWEYMSNFVKKLEKENINNVLNHIYIYIYELAIRLKEIYSLSQVQWQEFFIEDVCEIRSGKDIYERERIEGKIPYITATASNNGIGYFVSNENKTFQERCISVNRNGSVGYSFYHDYGALYGNDTRKLIPKMNDPYVAKFISLMISKQKEKYGYGYKMGTGRLKRQKILLPVQKNDVIDYDFMKKYMLLQEIETIHEILQRYSN